MEVLVILVPLALGLGLVGLGGFLWSLKSGQYDDLEGAAWRAIGDDDGDFEQDQKPTLPESVPGLLFDQSARQEA
jgi:cbb3-type cytochrome oxidase maturation protein